MIDSRRRYLTSRAIGQARHRIEPDICPSVTSALACRVNTLALDLDKSSHGAVREMLNAEDSMFETYVPLAPDPALLVFFLRVHVPFPIRVMQAKGCEDHSK